MTDLSSSRPDLDTSRAAHGRGPMPSAWTGWIAFASFMMILLGSFQVIEGLVALFDDGFYLVSEGGLVVDVDYNVWGTVHLLLGLLLIATGIGVMAGNLAARTFGVVLAALSALANMAFIGAYPVWSILVITIDVVVIYALVVHGREMSRTGR